MTSAFARTLRNPLDVDAPSAGKTLMLVGGIAALAAMFGFATVKIGDAFADRPIFLLTLPLAIFLGVFLFLDAKRLLLALVLFRAALNPIFDVTRLPVVGGLGGLVNLVVIGLSLLLLLQSRQRIPRAAWLPWVPFLAIVFVNVARAPEGLVAARAAAAIVTFAAVYYCTFHCVRNAAELDRTLRWFLLSALPVFAYTIVINPLLGMGGADGRFNGPFAHPNLLGFYLVIVLAAWLAKVRQRPGAPLFTLRAIGWWAYLVVLLALLLGTQTRNAWAGALIVLAIYGLWVQRGYLVFIVVASLVALAIPDVRDRVFDLTRNNEVFTYSTLNSYAWRKYLWTSALAWMSPLSYLTGNGVGAFVHHSTTFFPLAGRATAGAHNAYMQLLFDVGIFGVIGYLVAMAIPGWLIWKQRALPARIRFAALGLIASFAFMCYGDNMLDYLVVNWPFWFVVGLVTSLALQSPAVAWQSARNAARPWRRAMQRP